MPLTRYQVRNEYSLADSELYKAADKDDPEALLEGVAMAGLVGVLRQLGDLAEFAAEIFHDLHEEVMVTASRGHTLMVRVQQLESDFPPIEKAFLSQTTQSTFFSDSGTEWHPNLQMNQNLITKGDLPRFVMDSYEEARGPPRLFLLDKFDIAGAGSCLKRYTDPSFYKVEASFLDMASVDVQKDRKFRRAKKKGPRWKHGETPEFLPSSKLHQLFLEERVESGASEPARLVKLKRKSSASALGSVNGKSYMEKFLKTPLEDKVVHEVSIGSPPMKSPSKSTSGSGLERQRLDVSNVGPDVGPVQRIRGPFPPPSRERTIIRPSENDFFEDIVEEKPSMGATSNPSFDDKDMEVDREIKVDERESYHSDGGDDASEIDNYMDALATIESDVETDTEFRAKKEDVGFLDIEKHETDSDPNGEQLQSQSQFSDSQSVGNFTASDDGNGSIRKGLSSFSYSYDTASTSAEDTPSTETGNAEVTCTPSNQDSIIEKVRPDQLVEKEASDNACTESDDKSGELESDEELSDSSEILSDVAETEEQPMNDKSEISSGPTETEERVADESGEISSGLSKIEEKSTDNNGEYSGGPTKREEEPENVDDVLWRNDDIAPTVSCEKHMDDEAELEDSIVDSSTVIDTANILEEIHEKKGSENKFEDVVQTKLVEDVPARNSVDTQVMSPDSFIAHPEEEPSVLHLKELAGNTNDDLSDKLDSAEIGLVHFEERDFDETRDGILSRDSESDVEEGGIEPCANLVARDYPSHFSGYEDPPILAEDYSQSDDREDKMVHTEDEAERARNSSLLENLAQSNEREEGNEEILESEPTRACSHIEETNCITDQLDLQPPEGSGLSSQFEPIDSRNVMNNADFDFSALTIPTQPLEQDKALQVEELDVSTPLVDKVTCESSQSNTVDSNETDRESWPGPISVEGSVSAFPQASNLETPPSVFPGFNLLPEVAQVNLEEMPPLPPLPPMQWRIGKFPHASIPSGRDDGQQNNHFPPVFPSIRNENVQASNPFLPLPRHENFTGNMVNSTPLSLQMPIPNLGESQEDYVVLKETQYSKPSAEVSVTYSERSLHAGGEVVIQPTPDHSESRVEFLSLGQTQSSSPFAEVSATNNEEPQEDQEGEMVQPTVDHSDCLVDFLAVGQSQTQSSNPFTAMPETCNETPHQGSPDGEGGMIQPTDSHQLTPAITPGPTSTCSSETPNGESNQSPLQSLIEASLGKEEHDHSSVVSEMTVVGPPEEFVPLSPVENRQPEHVEPTIKEESICCTSTSALPSVVDEKPNALPSVNDEKPNALPSVNDEKPNAVPSVDDEKPDTLPSVDHEKPNGNQIPKLPRPWSPLIDAVAAHDKSKLRKVTERVRPQEQKVEERDSVLEQIRTKSFNLKPAVATRPTIQGPRTNLRVAAILEKANAIRQAFAGSDDDEDSWSDS